MSVGMEAQSCTHASSFSLKVIFLLLLLLLLSKRQVSCWAIAQSLITTLVTRKMKGFALRI
jgi:hypothetical protein